MRVDPLVHMKFTCRNRRGIRWAKRNFTTVGYTDQTLFPLSPSFAHLTRPTVMPLLFICASRVEVVVAITFKPVKGIGGQFETY